jgi:hypothetical protein
MTIACEYYASRDDKLSHKIVRSLRVRESGSDVLLYDIVKLYEGLLKYLMKGVNVIFPKVWNYKLVFCFL